MLYIVLNKMRSYSEYAFWNKTIPGTLPRDKVLSLHNTESGTTFAPVQFLLWWLLCSLKEKLATSLAGPLELAHLVGPVEWTYQVELTRQPWTGLQLRTI